MCIQLDHLAAHMKSIITCRCLDDIKKHSFREIGAILQQALHGHIYVHAKSQCLNINISIISQTYMNCIEKIHGQI